jgi:hypothetical protein
VQRSGAGVRCGAGGRERQRQPAPRIRGAGRGIDRGDGAGRDRRHGGSMDGGNVIALYVFGDMTSPVSHTEALI